MSVLKKFSLIADDVEPRGDLGPPSGSPINTSVLPFWNGLLERLSPNFAVTDGCYYPKRKRYNVKNKYKI